MAGERTSGGGNDKQRKYPVGFRFKPTPEELVEWYLLPKLQGRPAVPNDAIIEADVYECDPEILINHKYKRRGENAWFFLSPRTRKYPRGSRPARRTADNRGRWKPSTGKSEEKDAATDQSEAKEKLCKGGVKFCENTLAYHLGPPKNEVKTKWLMHELTVPEYEIKINSGTMLLDRYVMCTIYKSPLNKWNEDEEGETSSAREEAGPSSRPGPGLESGQVTLSNKQAGKSPAVEQLRRHATAPKRASQPTLALGPPAPRHGGGGGGMRVPLGVRATGHYGVPGQPAPMPWPPAMRNRLQQGPVQRPPLLAYKDNNGRTVLVPYRGQAPVQGPPPALRPCPPHRAAAPNSPAGRAMLMRPRNLAAGQPVPMPPFPRPPQQPKQEMDDTNRHRVLTQVLDALKSQEAQRSVSCAEQQQRPTASTPPHHSCCFDVVANHTARAMVPHPQFSAPHSCYPYIGGQQKQQCSLAIPAAASVPGGTEAPVPATPASHDNALSKLPVLGDANEGKGDRDSNGNHLFAELATVKSST